jgi:hypothetical protein
MQGSLQGWGTQPLHLARAQEGSVLAQQANGTCTSATRKGITALPTDGAGVSA